MQGNAVLVMDMNEPIRKLHIEYIREDQIPEHLNGESGFHIYHVRMLTELILRRYIELEKGLELSDQEIREIAIASSLHDVGKNQIPVSILESPNRLAPVEYDIVKKHTVFGEAMIEQAEAVSEEITPSMLHYAKEIARSHHERFDGTGYPDGLIGEAIPIGSQAVALADAYDALTSSRKYKQAYSQETALQMIANGMCGVFQEKMVEALIQVVNSTALVSLRMKILKNGTVIAKQDITVPKTILCAGNTRYLTKEFLNETFPESNIIISGESAIETSEHRKVVPEQICSLERLFDTYDFDTVIYFSGDLSYRNREGDDASRLLEVLKLAAGAKQEIKMIYLSSLHAMRGKTDPEALLADSKEKLCELYGRTSGLDMKILRIPYLYTGAVSGDFLYEIFEKMEHEHTVRLEERAETPLCFLSMDDLSDLLDRLFHDWKSGEGILNIGDPFHLTFGDLAKRLQAIGKSDFQFEGSKVSYSIDINNKALKYQYGWFAKISILEDIPTQYEAYQEQKHQQKTSYLEKIKDYLNKHRTLLGGIELILLFLLTEFLNHITDSAVVFSIVDFRMAYIVILSLTHGLSFGLAAAALSSVSWLIAKVMGGALLLTIFYEPTNWLPFIYYFLIAGVCGYIKVRAEDNDRFAREKIQLLEEKLSFTQMLYTDTYQEKRDLKKQIIGSKDSFGKIFDIARRLDTVELQHLYLQVMDVFETVLENKSISVYSVNAEGSYGRLEVASRDSMDTVVRSISLDTYQEIVAHVTDGEIWRNVRMKPEFPMYAAGVFRDGKLALLIFIWQANADQQSLYYANLFKILKDLVQMSLLRALQYNQAVYAKQYIPDTEILNVETFASVRGRFSELAERKVSRFVLLEIDIREHSIQEANAVLSKKIRKNDVLGMLENGNLGVLLSQASEKDMDVILPRFQNLEMDISVHL